MIALSLLIIFIGALGLVSIFIRNDIKSFEKRSDKIRTEIAMLADLIKMNRDWVKDEYVWFHPSGISLWVACEKVGLSVRWGAKNNREYHTLSDAGKWRLTPLEYKLVVEAMGDGAKKIENSDVAIVAQRISEMYGGKDA